MWTGKENHCSMMGALRTHPLAERKQRKLSQHIAKFILVSLCKLEGRQAGIPSCVTASKGILPRQNTRKTRCMASLFFCESCKQIYPGRFAVCFYVWDLLIRLCPQCQILYIHPATALQCHPVLNARKTLTSWCHQFSPWLSIYSDSRVDVNQARLVEGKDPQNELFRHVCKLT